MTKDRRITLFGGSGFIGRYVVQRLAREGWIVRVAVRDPAAALFLKPLGNVGQIVPIRADLTDAASVGVALEGSEAAVNLVGILYESGQQTFERVHRNGARIAAEAAASAGAQRFVQISAIGADPKAKAQYARSKGEAEAAVRAAFPSATILRPSIVFGPEDGFFNRFAAMARFFPALPLIGGGHTKFQPVYVGDVADAVMRAVNDPATGGKTYELGGPRVYTFRELMEVMLAQLGRRRLLANVPWGIARLQGAILEKLPGPKILTRDQVTLLERDNVVGTGALTLADLGIAPQAVEAIIPTYLDIYRRGGRFARSAA
jgi:NADH dehydrogenase